MLQPQQRGIWAASATYTTAHSNTGSLTQWARPGMEPVSSWILARFVNHWAMMGTPPNSIFLALILTWVAAFCAQLPTKVSNWQFCQSFKLTRVKQNHPSYLPPPRINFHGFILLILPFLSLASPFLQSCRLIPSWPLPQWLVFIKSSPLMSRCLLHPL